MPIAVHHMAILLFHLLLHIIYSCVCVLAHLSALTSLFTCTYVYLKICIDMSIEM